VSAGAALAWTLLLRRRLDDALGYALTAFIVCAIVLETIDYACTYLLPLDLAGTPPPDPRNARMRFLVTAALQIPGAFLVAAILVRPFRLPRRNRK
jgi:hypothetical protein